MTQFVNRKTAMLSTPMVMIRDHMANDFQFILILVKSKGRCQAWVKGRVSVSWVDPTPMFFYHHFCAIEAKADWAG